jgi:hypothetical protein
MGGNPLPWNNKGAVVIGHCSFASPEVSTLSTDWGSVVFLGRIAGYFEKDKDYDLTAAPAGGSGSVVGDDSASG